MSRHVLGVDAGGTKTVAAVADDSGRVVGIGTGGPGNSDGVGARIAQRSLADAVGSARSAAGIDVVDASFAGVAGVVTEADRTAARAMLSSIVGVGNSIDVDHDCRIALAGGLSGRPGIVLIAGTGASAFGRTATGADWLASGWGSSFGDEGSSFWLAREGLRAAARACDGRGEPTLLCPLLFDHLGVIDPRDLPGRVARGALQRPELASLAPLVVSAAESGDEVAGRLVRAAAGELAAAVAAVDRALDFAARPEVVLIGGLLNSELVSTAVRAKLAEIVPGARVVAPEAPPVLGAVLLALARTHGVEPHGLPESVVDTLRESSRQPCARTLGDAGQGGRSRAVPEETQEIQQTH